MGTFLNKCKINPSKNILQAKWSSHATISFCFCAPAIVPESHWSDWIMNFTVSKLSPFCQLALAAINVFFLFFFFGPKEGRQVFYLWTPSTLPMQGVCFHFGSFSVLFPLPLTCTYCIYKIYWECIANSFPAFSCLLFC